MNKESLFDHGLAFFSGGGLRNGYPVPALDNPLDLLEWMKGFCAALAEGDPSRHYPNIRAALLDRGVDGDLLKKMLLAAGIGMLEVDRPIDDYEEYFAREEEEALEEEVFFDLLVKVLRSAGIDPPRIRSICSELKKKRRESDEEFKIAAEWCRKAAELGLANAQVFLGHMYDNGRGVPQDFQEAAKWYCLAAEQGDAGAQFNLGEMYAEGRGVPQNKIVAYALFNLAAVNDAYNKMAMRFRNTLLEKMTPREIEAGQALSRELAKPGNFGKALDAYLKQNR
jgi:hypothetical protein